MTDESKKLEPVEPELNRQICGCLGACKGHPRREQPAQGEPRQEFYAKVEKSGADTITVDGATAFTVEERGVEGMSAEQRHDSFWVVEQFADGKSSGYWDGGSSRDFQKDINKAIQFCRKEDAYWATRGWHWTDAQITEHLYMQIDSTPKSTNGLPVKGWNPAPIEAASPSGMSAEQLAEDIVGPMRPELAKKVAAKIEAFAALKVREADAEWDVIAKRLNAEVGELREERDALKTRLAMTNLAKLGMEETKERITKLEKAAEGVEMSLAQFGTLLERAERAESALAEARNKAIDVCLDMANRYDQDIEGCDGDELNRFSEGITCCFRLAHIIKYDKFPPDGDAWSVELVERSKVLALKSKPESETAG